MYLVLYQNIRWVEIYVHAFTEFRLSGRFIEPAGTVFQQWSYGHPAGT
jgi:hypothetical protein